MIQSLKMFHIHSHWFTENTLSLIFECSSCSRSQNVHFTVDLEPMSKHQRVSTFHPYISRAARIYAHQDNLIFALLLPSSHDSTFSYLQHHVKCSFTLRCVYLGSWEVKYYLPSHGFLVRSEDRNRFCNCDRALLWYHVEP